MGHIMIQAKYAIVIVTYNREALLRECIRQVNCQTVQASSIVIVNNASTDGTNAYLDELENQGESYDIINLPQNIGGAGGFAKGIECAAGKDVECVLIIDDDAMIARDYMETILQTRQTYPQYRAFAGVVKVNDRIDTFHRRSVSKAGLLFKNCGEEKYLSPYFECEIASFCGMVLDTEIIRQIGLPHSGYFIWHDDAEYSLRVGKYSRFLVVTGAVLEHKTKLSNTVYPRRYDWKEYYAVRNRILLVREHGTILDRVLNAVHLFIHVIFRNWLFGLVKKDHYDWKYENDIVKKAIKAANSRDLRIGEANGIAEDIVSKSREV